jgi:hypothetical protein
MYRIDGELRKGRESSKKCFFCGTGDAWMSPRITCFEEEIKVLASRSIYTLRSPFAER